MFAKTLNALVALFLIMATATTASAQHSAHRRSSDGVLCLAPGTKPATARVSAADVAKVVSCIRAGTCKHLLWSKNYEPPLEGRSIVFVAKGKRYSFYWTGDGIKGKNDESDPLPPWLTVSVRPNGTTSQALVDSCTDNRLDGTVNYGADGANPARRQFSDGSLHENATGLEHRAYWQRQYDTAIRAALKRLF